MTAGLQSGQWGRKKAAAAALTQICQTSGDALAPHLPAVLDALLKVGGFETAPSCKLCDCQLVMIKVGSKTPPSCELCDSEMCGMHQAA